MSRRSTRATISVAVSLADASRGLSRPLRSRVSQMLFGIAGVIAWTGRGVLRDVSLDRFYAAIPAGLFPGSPSSRRRDASGPPRLSALAPFVAFLGPVLDVRS